jgi:hypothetical protein
MAIEPENPAGSSGDKKSSEVEASVLHGVKELKIVVLNSCLKGVKIAYKYS